MTDPSRRPVSMRKGSQGSSAQGTTPQARPRFILYAIVALVASAVFGLIAAGTLFTSTATTWLRDGLRDSYSDNAVDTVKDLRKDKPVPANGAAQLTTLETAFKALKDQPSNSLDLGPVTSALATVKGDFTSKDQKDKVKTLTTRADDLKNLPDRITTQRKSVLVSSIVVSLALALAAASAYRGKSWARWAVLVLWVLATFTSALVGIGSLLAVAADIPAVFKVPAFLGSLALVVAVVLVNLRPSVEYFNANKPPRPAGAPGRRGLFGPPAPRTPRTAAAPTTEATTRPARSERPDRSRSKQRSNADAVAKGAELARTRAKASKSRRTGS